MARSGSARETPAAVAVVLLLTGVATLLPWLVEAVVRRLDGGAVAWQLAVRRLQLDGGASARVVSGIAVAVAGAIALQTLFSGVQAEYTHPTGADLRRAQLVVEDYGRPLGRTGERLAAAPGVRGRARRHGVRRARADDVRGRLPGAPPARGDPRLRGRGRLRHRARPGGVARAPRRAAVRTRAAACARACSRRPPPPRGTGSARLGPPRAVVYVRLDPGDRDAIERVRNAAASAPGRT